MDIEKEIFALQARNKKVELEKARETSRERKVLIAVLTYIVVCLFFVVTGTAQPFLSALVPTGGFVFSTLSFGYLKKRRIHKHQ